MITNNTAKPIAILWADYDPHAGRGNKWATYSTKADQRANRPDLKPLRIAIFPFKPKNRAKPAKAGTAFLTHRMEATK